MSSRITGLLAESEKLLADDNRVIRDRILNAFDFASVADVMARVGSVYHDGAPTAERLKEIATLLLNDELNDPREEGCQRSGGFEVWKDNEEVSLSFTLQARSYDRDTDEIIGATSQSEKEE